MAETDVYTFKIDELPEQSGEPGMVRFGSVTPKQSFDDMEQFGQSLEVHLTRALEHLAAFHWLATDAPKYKAPKRTKETATTRVTIPVDHENIREEDFAAARRAAGMMHGVYPKRTVYLGRTGSTGDGRAQHVFEVTYEWSGVAHD